jgi:uncharacterized protein with GYD domain
MVKHPEHREAAVRQVVESNGAKLIGFYWMFGNHDGLAIYETSDAIAAATVLAGIRASGRIEHMATSSLLTGDEAQQVLELAKYAAIDYAPPGGRTDWHSDYDLLAYRVVPPVRWRALSVGWRRRAAHPRRRDLERRRATASSSTSGEQPDALSSRASAMSGCRCSVGRLTCNYWLQKGRPHGVWRA